MVALLPESPGQRETRPAWAAFFGLSLPQELATQSGKFSEQVRPEVARLADAVVQMLVVALWNREHQHVNPRDRNPARNQAEGKQDETGRIHNASRYRVPEAS